MPICSENSAGLPEWEQRAPTDTTTYHDYWDLDVHYAWVEGMDEPLIGGKHNMPCIPIVVQGEKAHA